MLSLQSFPREGRVVGPCWEKLKSKGPKSFPYGLSVGLDVIRKEAWSFYRTISGVHLCWELDGPEGPKGPRTYGRACRWATVGEAIT